MGWWDEAFRSAYLEVYHHRTDAAATAEIAGLLPPLRAAPGPVVDAGCGAGRHLAALRAAGLPAVGFDLSADLLAALRPGCRGRVARADLRAPPLAGGCGAVLCLFTAFGYFDDAANQACLAGLAGLVAPAGWVVLDLPDPALVRSTLVPHSQRQTPRGWTVRETRRIAGTRVIKTVEAQPPMGESVRWTEHVRLYESDEVAALASACGLMLDAIWPGLEGPDRPNGRMVAWLRRPGGGASPLH